MGENEAGPAIILLLGNDAIETDDALPGRRQHPLPHLPADALPAKLRGRYVETEKSVGLVIAHQ
ncbi:hypothetical protein D3C72_2425360 [compost metagenome]